MLAEIWGSQLGLEAVGIHDRFFDLGGHSLLAAQIASEICDRFQIELPVLKLFQAPTIGELAVLVDQARAASALRTGVRVLAWRAGRRRNRTELQGNAPEVAAKASYREFYNDVTRRLEQSGMGAASFFLNYGYVSLGQRRRGAIRGSGRRCSIQFGQAGVRTDRQHATKRSQGTGCRVRPGWNSGATRRAFGAAWRRAWIFRPRPSRSAGARTGMERRFEVGDAEHLPFEDESFEVVTNMESSHTYPNLRAFFSEVRRVLAKGGCSSTPTCCRFSDGRRCACCSNR